MKLTVLLLSILLASPFLSRGATIFGVIKFRGDPPERRILTEISANSFCGDYFKGNLPRSDRFVFGKSGKDNTLANVLVYVSKGAEGRTFEPPKDPVLIDQIGCIYTPHVVALMVGQTLEVRNSDATLHNVMSRPKQNKVFNDGMPGTAKKLFKIFDKPEVGIDLRCFMHPWMLGYVHVMENPFFAISGPDGSFKIKDLPAGQYEISVFHEYSRFSSTPEKLTVKVEQDDTRKIEFSFYLPGR